ncbi:MAG TPA: hypothetical protein VNK46_08740 [Nitrospiraceae bacterium]|jgi:hypothetical protein|nr:hypothetical protein [Nitrospiraceae bacterium]
MDIEIGSNMYRNTNGTIEIEGVPQMTISLSQPGGPLLVSFAMFDENSRMAVKIVDSIVAFNEKRAYDLSKTPTSLLLKHRETGKVVLKMEVKKEGVVAFTQGEFRTIKGHTLVVSPTEWKIDKLRMSGGDNDMKGGAVVIG